MDSIGALIAKLKLQFDQKAEAADMLATVQALQLELGRQQPRPARTLGTSKVAVMMPAGAATTFPADYERYAPRAEEEKIVEKKETVLIEENKVSIVQDNGQLDMVFDPLTEIPTLSQQLREERSQKPGGVEPESINDRLRQPKVELVEILKETPVKDLRKAIGINDRFLFIDDLFRGDEAMYERSIKTINNFTIYAEAEYWISRELKTKLGWNNDHPTVLQFDQLVRRRFS